MPDVTLTAALLAGLVSFLSPCVLPLVPPYLVYLTGATLDDLAEAEANPALVRRAVLLALVFVAGFSTVFVAMGASASLIGAYVRMYSATLSMVAGVVIIVMGLHFLGLFRIPLLSGGDKAWGRFSPYRDLGYQAAAAATAGPVALGSVGGGTGATTADLKGGIGSASAIAPSGHRVGAIVIVNAVGSATIGASGHFWAATDEVGAEFGGRGLPSPWPADAHALKLKGARPENTTIALVVTDAALDKGQATHLAVMAQDGLGRAIRPIHTPLDGDTVFAAATGTVPVGDYARDMAAIGFTAASVLARACARAVFEAEALPFPGALPSWKQRFGAR